MQAPAPYAPGFYGTTNLLSPVLPEKPLHKTSRYGFDNGRYLFVHIPFQALVEDRHRTHLNSQESSESILLQLHAILEIDFHHMCRFVRYLLSAVLHLSSVIPLPVLVLPCAIDAESIAPIIANVQRSTTARAIAKFSRRVRLIFIFI